MQIKEIFADILQQNIPKYLKLTYNEVKPYLDGSSAFTEIVNLSIDGKETWAQLELNPLYEFYENEELVIRSVFMINNGCIAISCGLFYPETQPPYAENALYESKEDSIPVYYRSL